MQINNAMTGTQGKLSQDKNYTKTELNCDTINNLISKIFMTAVKKTDIRRVSIYFLLVYFVAS